MEKEEILLSTPLSNIWLPWADFHETHAGSKPVCKDVAYRIS
jgi:hypothetical protein